LQESVLAVTVAARFIYNQHNQNRA